MLSRLLLFSFLLPSFVFAQDTVPLIRSFKIAYENDLLTIPVNGRTDYYYTGGTFLEFNLPFLKRNPVSKILLKLPQGHDEAFGIEAGNLGFTPTSIRSDSILFGDRPFSATIYLGLNRVSCNSEKRTRLKSELDLGIIGPLAFGYETQKFIHAHTNNPEPHGWQFQVENDAYVNYFLRLEKGFLQNNFVDLVGHGFVNAGTIYDNAGLGLTLYTGKMNSRFSPTGVTDRFLFWGYARIEGKLIARDATLQGGIFNSGSVYVIAPGEIKRGLLSGTFGTVLAYKRLRFEWFNTFLGPEFNGGRKHAWGHLGIEYFF